MKKNTEIEKAVKEILKLKGYSETKEVDLDGAIGLKNQNLQVKNTVDFIINGGKKLRGEIETNCSKNGAMGLICASLLNKGRTTLHGIPRIEEVSRIVEVLVSIDVDVRWESKNTLSIKPPEEYNLSNIDSKNGGKTRSILMFIAPLIHKYKNFSIPHSQGCHLGTRTIKPHLLGLSNLGVEIEVTENSYEVYSPLIENNKKNSEIVMWEASDTGTEMMLMAASKVKGETVIKYASSNYMVQDVCFYLQKLGVKIDGIGTHKLIVQGVGEIDQDIEFYNSQDPIETMMFITAAIVTESEIVIKKSPIEFLEIELLKLKEMGLKYNILNEYKSENGYTKLVDLKICKSSLNSLPDKITCGAYPDLNMDNLPFFVPICCLSTGKSLIHDWVYENRAIYFTELNRLGASISLADPHRVYIHGIAEFSPAQVVCPPALRPAMIIMLGMLSAKGVSILRNVYSIRRGYQEIAKRLNSLGADIQIIQN